MNAMKLTDVKQLPADGILIEYIKEAVDLNEQRKKPAAKKKKKIPKKPKYVGSVKCNGSCHDPYYQAWVDSPHGKTFDLLKPGQRAEAKKKA
ncbi:MAG: hypothetical protein IH991_15585, partial [Planctomycetes bacterium]|nr:hypothetical protein [Planctomycetota bacterium]